MKDAMLAAVFEGDGRLALQTVPVPTISAPDHVLLRVTVAAVCGTDVHILDVPPGHPATAGTILGHEYVGEVIEVGDAVRHVAVGDQVAVGPNLSCGFCEYCRVHQYNMCSNMTTLGIFRDGGFAEYNLAPGRAVYRVDRRVPPEVAVFAEPLSCVVGGSLKVRLHPGETVLVLGAGPIGLCFVQVFRASGAGKIIVAEVNQARAEMARHSGATRVVNPREEDLATVVRAETETGVDVAVDAVGSLFLEALAATRSGGKTLLFGMNSTAQALVHQNDITRREIKVLGTYIGNGTFPLVIRMLEAGLLDLRPLITHRVSLQEVADGIAAMRSGEAVKVLVFPE